MASSLITPCLLGPLVLLVLSVGYSESFHFDLSRFDQMRCFVEELEDDVTIRGSYNVTFLYGDHAEPTPGTVKIDVTDGDRNTVVSKIYKAEGTFAFSSNGHGMHQLCFSRPENLGDQIVRVTLHYEEHPTDVFFKTKENEEGEEKPTEKTFKALISVYENIENNLQKLKKREKRFRDLSKTTNNRVLWWALFQVIVLAATAFWQMRHLTKFFILKKLA